MGPGFIANRSFCDKSWAVEVADVNFENNGIPSAVTVPILYGRTISSKPPST